MSDVWTSLQDFTASIAPSYTKAVIQAGLRSLQGERYVWIVVEDIDDVNVYERFFNQTLLVFLLLKMRMEIEGILMLKK